MNEMNQKDLVLSINEYAYVLDETKGQVTCLVGPTKMSLSQSDRLVNFNERTKAFEACNFVGAKHLFVTIPENWYCILKNPVDNNRHPIAGSANSQPEKMNVGRKINIQGPSSFALYPGQMAKVIRGHALRSNQYLLARVYEAESANQTDGEIINSEGKKVEIKKNYVNGQILVIKGTEVSFYIPPTGIEVIPVNKDKNEYIREAITLERLEYCILKDEDGNKRYVHGPEVVFPKPTEIFVENKNHNYIFRAIELSKISGIYVKVIAEYVDENEVTHPVGEELFITGNDQMIYYPRPEHAIINYDGKILHHAIAIPDGEGRYIMDRLTGNINTVLGPSMYLPDPRTEIVIKRKLTPKECELWYPGNMAALKYNMELNEKQVEKKAVKECNPINLTSAQTSCNYSASSLSGCVNTSYVNSISDTVTLDSLEAKSNISRGTSYTKPRTITLDNKFDGVVSIDVWTGYAINVISKNGDRKVVCGPQTVLLDYDQTLESMNLSTGKPKTTDKLEKTVFLCHENNKISDIVNVTTKDYVEVQLKVSYCVNFDKEYQDKWFNINNYVKYLCDFERSVLKREAKHYTIEEFYQNYHDIVMNIVLNKNSEGNHPNVTFFEQNGMYIYDCDILGIKIESAIESMLEEHRQDMVDMALRLSNAEKHAVLSEKLAKAKQEERRIKSETILYDLEVQKQEQLKNLEYNTEIHRKQEAEEKATHEAKMELQTVKDLLHEAKLAQQEKEYNQKIEFDKKQAEIEKAKQEAYAATVREIVESISPDLIAALSTKANAEILSEVSKSMSPYAIANNESISDTVNKLLRGTSLENFLEKIKIAGQQ